MTSAVFDSVTLLQAATNSTGPAGACLGLVDEGRVKMFLSAVLLDEVRDVLNRPKIRKAFPDLKDEQVRDFLEHLVAKGHTVKNVPAVYRLDRDPDDEPLLNLAIASGAMFIVSRDKDLLDLMRNDVFRTAYPTITVLNPVAFLQHVRDVISAELQDH